MAIKWKVVKITDKSGKFYRGLNAHKFVRSNCPDAISDIERQSLADIVRVKLPDGGTSLDVKDIKDVLSLALGKIGASLTIMDGQSGTKDNFPVARAVQNVVNVIPSKLKVEFIYKQDPRSDTKIYLKDPVVAVTADFAGNERLPASQTKKDAPQGIADHGIVAAGKYKLTPDYFKLEPCKFDFEVKPLDIDLKPGEDKTVTFEVEPLYQKVQLIAHCLLAIPDRTYEPGPNETLVANPKYPATPNQPPKKVVATTNPLLPSEDVAADVLKGQWKGKYHGKIKDKEDIDARVNLVKATLDFAYTKAKGDPTILKVFMIPECYFQGLYGSYLIGEPEKGKVDDNHIDGSYLFNKLLDLAGGVQWRDWIFVFGTVNLTFGEDVREMMNYSPVIRGGLGGSETAKASDSGGETDKQLRLIQKLVNSAELLDKSELIKKGGETREPSVNDAVQFQATQNEEQVGQILSRLFDETSYKVGEDKTDLKFGESKGLSPEQWKQLQEELNKDVKALGLTRVVRSIRLCNIQKTSDTLTDWVFSGFKDKKTAHLLSNEVFLIKDNPFQKIFDTSIKQEWENYWREMLKPEVRFKPAFSKLNWNKPSDKLQLRNTDFKNDLLDDLGVRQKRILENIKNIIVELSCSEYQDEKLREVVDIENLLIAPATLPAWTTGKSALFDDEKAITTNLCFSKYPIWKKLLELYYKDKLKDVAFLTQSIGNMNYKDYCFATARKAGTWLTFEQVEKLEPCKKLVFGLEICADHANGRLAYLVQENLPPVLEGEILKELEMIKDDDKLYTKEEREKKNAEMNKENLKIRIVNQPLIANKTKIKEVQDRNDKKPKVTVDIQLLPSAGMFPLNNNIVARNGGYCFNCDGWNKGLGTGVNLITVWFDDIEAKNVSPVTPHTAIAKGGGVSLDMAAFNLEKIPLSTVIDPGLGNDILNQNGLGELHIYEESDLPKN